jgi:Flp pilus assembly protein TadD
VTGDADRSGLIHREIFQLGALVLVAVAAFLLTRAVAASNRDMNLRDAAEWYRRGQAAVAAGRVDEAVDALRRATVRNRDEKTYVLALAHALALEHDDQAARAVLMTLREAAPEDAEINLQLARLAAAGQDVTEASRFYHNALYAPWPAEQTAARRGVRLELIRFLLAHDQPRRALAELFAVSSDLPDDPAVRLDVARLFAEAGDHAHALDQFKRLLRQTPADPAAIAGAGLAAFQMGDYALARTYLHRVPADAPADVRNTREVVDLVLSRDPLANRIGSAERRRRLTDDLEYARQRVAACAGGNAADADRAALDTDARAFGDQLRKPGVLEQDTVEAGVDLIDRLQREIARRCGPLTALDQALALIGRTHGDAAR